MTDLETPQIMKYWPISDVQDTLKAGGGSGARWQSPFPLHAHLVVSYTCT